MALSTFTFLTNTIVHLQNFFIFPEWNSVPIKYFPSSLLVAPGNHHSAVCMDLTTLGSSSGGTRQYLSFLWLPMSQCPAFIHVVAWLGTSSLLKQSNSPLFIALFLFQYLNFQKHQCISLFEINVYYMLDGFVYQIFASVMPIVSQGQKWWSQCIWLDFLKD